jgi:hypothetical protein
MKPAMPHIGKDARYRARAASTNTLSATQVSGLK